MTINNLMAKEKISKSQLVKKSKIPYATLNDICSGKTYLPKCSAETIYRLAKALNISMEELLSPFCEDRPDFELYKSNVCHQLKVQGDIAFLADILKNDTISLYYNREWYPECFYLLAMVDYISRINAVPVCEKYDALRSKKLQFPIFPASILALSAASQNDTIKAKSVQEAIPEFLRFNIIENEVRNVC